MCTPRLSRPPGVDQYDLAGLSGSKFLNDLVHSKRKEDTCTSTVAAKIVIEHPPPVPVAMELETCIGRAEYCERWQSCAPWGDPTTGTSASLPQDGDSIP